MDSNLDSTICSLKADLHLQKITLDNQIECIYHLKQQINEANKINKELYLFNSSNYFTIDHDYMIQNVNFNAAILFGIDRQYLINSLFLNYIHLDAKYIIKNAIQKALKNKFKQRCEIEIIQKGHDRKQVSVEVSVLSDEYLRLKITDLTQARQLELQILELKKSLSLVNNLAQHASDAIAAMDNQLYIKVITPSFNQIFSKIFAIKIHIGMNIKVALGDFPEARDKIKNAHEKSISGEKVAILFENHTGDVDLYYCYEMTIVSFHNQYSQINEFLFCIRDLTLYKLNTMLKHKQQAELAQAAMKSSIGEISSVFAHEITQPLTAILAYSQSCFHIMEGIENDSPLIHKLSMPLKQITRQAEHIGHIINNMKNLMLTNQLQLEKTNINTLIKDTISILNYEIPNFKLNICFKLMDNAPLILVNKTHIMQVILNLARNSIEALQHAAIEKPKLMIHTTAHNNDVVVHIIDNGPGIPTECMDKILNSHFTTKPLGTGVGLAICLNILESHGGGLKVQKKRKSGACFTFTLPCTKA